MKKTVCLLLVGALLLVSFCACAQPSQKTDDTFFFMDTLITVTLYAHSGTDTSAIFSECRAILEKLDSLWSRTREGSFTSKFNLSDGAEIASDRQTCELLERALRVTAATDGAFDITVAPLLSLWQSCEAEQRLPTDGELAAARSRVDRDLLYVQGQSVIKRRNDVQIDLGGIGKGAAISALVAYLDGCPIEGALISFGSNVATVGKKPDGNAFRVAVKNPIDGNDYARVVELSAGEVLSVSGDYERYYTIGEEKYHHIIDPATGYPAESGLCSVAVICADGALADALSTALFVMGEARARAFYASGVYDFEAIFITSDGIVSTTEGLQ